MGQFQNKPTIILNSTMNFKYLALFQLVALFMSPTVFAADETSSKNLRASSSQVVTNGNDSEPNAELHNDLSSEDDKEQRHLVGTDETNEEHLVTAHQYNTKRKLKRRDDYGRR